MLSCGVCGLFSPYCDNTNKFLAHCRPSEPFTWEGAATHYDKTRFQLPSDITMESVKSLTGLKALALAEYFMKQQETERFVFELVSDGEDSDEEEPVVEKKGKGKGKVGGKAKVKRELPCLLTRRRHFL